MAQISEIELNRYDMDILRNIYVGDVDNKEKEKKIMMINNLKKQELINLIMFMEMRSIELRKEKKEKKEELTKEEKKEELKEFLNPEKSPDLIPSFDEDMYNNNERMDVSSNEFDNNAGSYWFKENEKSKENNEKVLNMIKDYL